MEVLGHVRHGEVAHLTRHAQLQVDKFLTHEVAHTKVIAKSAGMAALSARTVIRE